MLAFKKLTDSQAYQYFSSNLITFSFSKSQIISLWGRVIYITCKIYIDINQEQIMKILKQRGPDIEPFATLDSTLLTIVTKKELILIL